MKKITLTFLFFLCCLFGYAQMEETFEGATFPPPEWGVYDNGIGINFSWTKNGQNNTEQPAYQGTNAAFIQREDVLTGMPEDWLVTKRFTVPNNGKISFYSRLTIVGDQGGIYQVKISTSPDQSSLADYTLMQEWTESQINGVQQREYVLKTLNFAPEFYNQEVYVAFIMKADFADRWLIDNVSVTENCLDPANLIAGNFTTTSAELSWDNPSLATQWEVEIVEENAPFTGTGTLYSGTLPYVPTLEEDTRYKYQVRAVCPLGGKSEWIGAARFKTSRKGDICTDPIVVNTLPYSNTDDTADAANNYNGTPGTNCGTFEWGSYIEGNDVIYQFTPTEDQIITIKASGLTNQYSSMFVYTSCADIGTNCFASDFNEFSLENLSIPFLNVTAGTTYYILFSTSWDTTPYFLTIQREYCDTPASLQATGLTTSSANLSWTETGTATSWQYSLVPKGTGLPQGAGTTTTALSYNATTLTAGTQYEFYVRSNCGDGTFSSWSDPLYFNTQCDPLGTPYTQNFNSDSATEFCWSVADLNNDGKVWDLDTQWTTSEGDQSASFFTDGSADNDDMLISPTLTIQPNLRLRFRYRTDSWNETAFKVTLSTTGTDPADFTTELLPLQAYSLGEFKTRILDLTPYAGQNVNIAWHVPPGEDGSGSVYIDDIIIEPWPACAEPTEPTASSITTTTAQLSWDNGHNETAWQIGIKETPATGGPVPPVQGDTLLNVSTNPYTATNLEPNTSYTYYVRASCGPNNVSQWVGPFTFRTACLPFAVPFQEGFNSDSETENCWKIVNANNDWSVWNVNSGFPTSFEGDEHASIYAGPENINDWLISPALMLTGNDRLKYHYEVGDGGGRFRVMLSTTGTDIANFTEVLVPSEVYDDTDGFLKKIVSLEAYSGTVYIAFHADPPSGGYSNINIDNFIVEPIPSCPEPLELAIDNLTKTSVDVSWTAGGAETQWEIFVQLPGQGLPTGAGTPATSPFTVTELTDGTPLESGTTYEVYVRAICNPGDASVWSDVLKFTTIISNDECVDAITVPVNLTGDCILFRAATTIGATMSAEEQCDEWSSDDDVWFTFEALSDIHTINFRGLPEFDSVQFAVYEGGCGALTSLICPSSSNSGTVLRNLTVGQTYTLRVFKYAFDEGKNFEICITTPVTPIAVSSTDYTPEQLVREILIGSECAQISNITYSTGTNFGGPNGIGSFSKNGSDFPFESGIVLTTGEATQSPGPNHDNLGAGGEFDWAGDTELEDIILEGTGVPMDSHNATILEFDFIPLIDTMTFDFLFASEEYGQYQCFYSDSFAFILTDSQGTKKNLAVLPNTEIPVSVVTIRDELYNDECDSQNVEYFDVYNGIVEGENFGDKSATNYNGQTVVLQAKANVIPGNSYHIKMVIADKGDSGVDSAVFLGAGSFDIGEMDLGADLLVSEGNALCSETETTLVSNLDAEAFIIKWFKDNVELTGETGSSLVVSESGLYTIDAQLIGSLCNVNDSIRVEYFPDVDEDTNAPENLSACNDGGKATFNLELNTTAILDGLDADDYTVTYHTSEADAEAGANALPLSYENTSTPQTVYARIVEDGNPCYAVKSFTLRVDALPDFSIGEDFTACEGTNSTIEVIAVNFDDTVATYAWTKDGVALTNVTKSIVVTESGVYEVTVTNGNCVATKSVTATILPAPVADAPANAEACDTYTLLPLSAGNRYFTATGGPDGTGTEIAAGSAITTTQTIYVFAESPTTPDCTSENSFVVTINATPKFTLSNPVVCLAENGVITISPENFELNEATYEWTLNGVTVGTGSSIEGTEFGTYEVTITIGDCTTTKSATITQDTNGVALSISDDCETGIYQVTASDDDGSFNVDTATYEWTGPDGFTSTDRTITPTVQGIYTVTIVTENGCIGEDSYPVTSTTCKIPRGVSPNNDEKNDTFDLSSLDVRKLAIFNRYGQEVYTKSNYKNEWHGQGKGGNELPTGTYFYMIERENGESVTGWVYLNREE